MQNELKKVSYWLSIGLSIVLGLLINTITDLFNVPKRAISYEEKQYKDTLFTDANGLTHDAVILNGAIWNSGQTTIDTSEVREPLRITLEKSKQILGFNLLWQTHPTTSMFRLNQIDSTNLGVNWRYFDPNNGFSFQIVYKGKERAKLKPHGRILYLASFTRVNPLLRPALGAIIFFIAFGLFGFSICTIKYFKKDFYESTQMVMLLIGAIASLVFAITFISVLIELFGNPSFEYINK